MDCQTVSKAYPVSQLLSGDYQRMGEYSFRRDLVGNIVPVVVVISQSAKFSTNTGLRSGNAYSWLLRMASRTRSSSEEHYTNRSQEPFMAAQ
jgi:hypothetical protein